LDYETISPCSGDNELTIGNIGDIQNFFRGKYFPYPPLTTGGGHSLSPDYLILNDTSFYNRELICNRTNSFLIEFTINGTLNYSEIDYNNFKNKLVIELGFGIDNVILESFINNFLDNCPEYKPKETIPILKKKFPYWILIVIFVSSIIFMLVYKRKRDKKVIMAVVLEYLGIR